MALSIGADRDLVQFVSVSLGDPINRNNLARIIDAYVDSSDLAGGLRYMTESMA